MAVEAAVRISHEGNGLQWNHEEEEARPSPAEMFTQVVGVDVVAQTTAVVDAVLGADRGTLLCCNIARLAQRVATWHNVVAEVVDIRCAGRHRPIWRRNKGRKYEQHIALSPRWAVR